MCPVMIEVFEEMYEEAYKLSKGRKTLIMFQKLLKEVPNWSDAQSKQHTDNIANRCAWFNDLIAAVSVSCVKILSAVRLSKDNKKISVDCYTDDTKNIESEIADIVTSKWDLFYIERKNPTLENIFLQYIKDKK